MTERRRANARDKADQRHCYEWSAELAVFPLSPATYRYVESIWSRVGADPACAVLVHGCPLSRRLDGRIGHAWVECRDLGVAVDVANGLAEPVWIGPLAEYYRRTSVQPAVCRYYTPAEALVWLRAVGHWGPWEPHPVEVIDPPPRGGWQWEKLKAKWLKAK